MILLFIIGEFCCYGERDYGGVCSIFKKEKKSADCFKRPSNAQRWDGGQESKSVNQSGRLRTKLYRESRNLSEARFEYRSKRAKDETRTVIIKQIKTFFGVRMKNVSQNKNRNFVAATILTISMKPLEVVRCSSTSSESIQFKIYNKSYWPRQDEGLR